MIRQNSENWGVVYVMVATVGVALKGIWASLAYDLGMDVSGVLFFRAAMATPLFLAVGFFSAVKNCGSVDVDRAAVTVGPPGQRWRTQRWHWQLLAVALGGLQSLCMLADFEAIAQLGASVSRVILFGFPFVVVLLDSVWQWRLPSYPKAAGLCCCVVGAGAGGYRWADSVRAVVGRGPRLGSGRCGSVRLLHVGERTHDPAAGFGAVRGPVQCVDGWSVDVSRSIGGFRANALCESGGCGMDRQHGGGLNSRAVFLAAGGDPAAGGESGEFDRDGGTGGDRGQRMVGIGRVPVVPAVVGVSGCRHRSGRRHPILSVAIGKLVGLFRWEVARVRLGILECCRRPQGADGRVALVVPPRPGIVLLLYN